MRRSLRRALRQRLRKLSNSSKDGERLSRTANSLAVNYKPINLSARDLRKAVLAIRFNQGMLSFDSPAAVLIIKTHLHRSALRRMQRAFDLSQTRN